MPKRDQTRLVRLLILTGLFLSAAGGAWAWYHVNPKRFPVNYAFHATDRIAGHVFKPEEVGPGAVEILATTNLFNGDFIGPKGEKFTAFMGTWDAADSKQMSVVAHTPDVCWVGAGAVPVSVGHPDKLELQFQGERIPFEVRTFRMPNQQLELTAWCTLVSGQVFAESERFELKEGDPEDRRDRQAQAARRVVRGNFLRMIRERVPGNGSKQFVRFSTALKGDWQPALERLQQFAQRWLSLQVTREEAAAR